MPLTARHASRGVLGYGEMRMGERARAGTVPEQCRNGDGLTVSVGVHTDADTWAHTRVCMHARKHAITQARKQTTHTTPGRRAHSTETWLRGR